MAISVAETTGPTEGGQSETDPERGRELARFDSWGLATIAAAKLAFHLATANLYGLHRDEFYYLAAGNHPAAGYVDQPPITPFLYRGWSTLFGTSQFSLHSLAAFLSIPMVFLGAMLARELGGQPWAQRATMTVAAVGTVFTTTFHFVSTVTVDLLIWGLACWLIIRLLRTEEVRLWLPIGVVAGIGFENKHTIVFWGAAVAAGLLATPQRRLTVTPWLAAGLAAFGVLAAPDLIWQATHEWASLSFYADLRRRIGTQNLVQFWPLQLGLMTVAGPALIGWGLSWLRSNPEARRYRAIVVAFVAVVILFFVTSGKGYYTAGIYLPVVAAGAVALERHGSVIARRRFLAAALATGVLFAPAYTPILPASTAVKIGLTKVNPDLGGMMGWHNVVNQISAVYRRLPASQKTSAVFLTRDYSEASALAYWRRTERIPAAISGHNNEWWWGWAPAAHAQTIIAVGLPRSTLIRYFTTVQPAGSLTSNRGPIDPYQLGLPVWICTGQRLPWTTIWPQLRLYA